jgi:hypothetical protein
MKTCAIAIVLLGMTLNLTACATASQQDHRPAHVTSPEQYRVLMENDQVLVLEMVLEPGESDRLHDHRDETVYFQQGGSLRISLPGGETMDVTVPDVARSLDAPGDQYGQRTGDGDYCGSETLNRDTGRRAIRPAIVATKRSTP